MSPEDIDRSILPSTVLGNTEFPPRPLDALATLVRDAEAQIGVTATVGIGIPGVISPATGRVKNANSIALNNSCTVT